MHSPSERPFSVIKGLGSALLLTVGVGLLPAATAVAASGAVAAPTHGEIKPKNAGGVTYESPPKKRQSTGNSKRKESSNSGKDRAKSPSKGSDGSSKQQRSGSSTSERRYTFPVLGDYNFGQEGAKFGADRGSGSKHYAHQGQDIIAPEGAAVVAPRNGTVTYRDYQASGAGYYLIIKDQTVNRYYAFMHLKQGSLRVAVGDTVRVGKRIAEVGNTGRSEGPHLHFEIWEGPWQTGGKPIDPLPILKLWQRAG